MKTERTYPDYSRAGIQTAGESFDRGKLVLVVLVAAVLAFGLGMLLPYFGYRVHWAPHRLFKILAGGIVGWFVIVRPTWIPYLLCLVFPFTNWLPKSPFPFVNTMNLLTLGPIVGISILTLRRKIRPITPTELNVPILAFMGWTIAAAVYGVYFWPGSQPLGIPLFKMLWAMLSGFVVFFVTTHLVLTRKEVWRLVAFLMIGSTIGLLGPIREVLWSGWGTRTSGGVGDINRMGAFLAIASVFTFSMIPAYQGLKKFGTGLSSVLQAIGMIFPNSRGAYVGFLVASLPQALRTSVLGTVLLIALLGTSAFWAPDFVRERVTLTWTAATADDRAAALDADSGGRITVWKTILRVVGNHPIIGVGAGNLHDATHLTGGIYKAGHNLFLEVAGESGVPGLLLLLWIFFRGWKLGSRLVTRGGRSAVLGRAYHGVLGCLLIVNIFGQRFLDFSLCGYFFLLTGLVVLEEKYTRPAPEEETS